MDNIWTFEVGVQRSVRSCDLDGRITFDEGPVTGFLDHAWLRDGISLYRLQAEARRGFVLNAPEYAPAGELVLGCVLQGAGELKAAGNEDQGWRGGGQAYAVSFSERQISYRLGPDQPLHLMALRLNPAILDLLMRDDDVPAPVARALDRKGEPLATVRASGPAILRAARELLHPSYQGAMGRLYREAKATEFLALHLGSFRSGDQAFRELTRQELSRVREAQELLTGSLQNPPDAATLAALVGLTPKKLNKGFRQLFGTTVFDYLLDARLSAARRRLEEDDEVSLKYLAWSLGYSQTSNFVSAFRRRFGIAPGAYRRRN